MKAYRQVLLNQKRLYTKQQKRNKKNNTETDDISFLFLLLLYNEKLNSCRSYRCKAENGENQINVSFQMFACNFF